MNMSYCRFRNTLNDLKDCQEALEEIMNGKGEALSPEELRAAKRLIGISQEIADYEEDEIQVFNAEIMERDNE